jgi:hypothetical protein
MGEGTRPAVGTIARVDLAVAGAERLRDSYREAVGWTVTAVPMGGFADSCMNAPVSRVTAAGVCYARGADAGLPPQWLLSITVAELEVPMTRCMALGGAVIAGPH